LCWGRVVQLCIVYCCSCTAFAGLDDTLSVAVSSAGAPGSSGVGGAGGRGSIPGGRPAGASGAGVSEPLDAAVSAGGGAISVGGAAGANDAGLAGGGDRDAEPVVQPCIGSALSLDGASAASIQRPIQDDFTLEAWIRTTASLAGTQYYQGRGVIDGDVIGGTVNDFSTTILNDTFAIGTGNPDVTLQGTSVVTSGEWVHVAATRRASDGQMQLIVNGVVDATGGSGKTGPLDGAMTLAFGGSVSTRHFIGELDEVRIWDVVRTPEEIRADMRQVSSGDEPGLVRYYRFEDAGGATTADTSRFNVPATLVGTPTFVASTALCSAP
jgi:Concanavalin A-like lectin/glucanases superfamily